MVPNPTPQDSGGKERHEQWLERAFAGYNPPEPRVGMENRILAGLRAERKRISARRCWGWTFGALVTAMIIAEWFGSRPAAQRGEAAESVAKAPESLSSQSAKRPVNLPPGKPVTLRTAAHMRVRATLGEIADRPKLDRFPSSQPLSEQGQLLIEYLETTPERELIAVATHPKEVGEVQIKGLEIPPLSSE